MLYLLLSFIFGLISIFGVIMIAGSFMIKDGASVVFIFVITTLLTTFICLLSFTTYKNNRKMKSERKNKMNELNAKDWAVFTHTIGLPLPERILCKLYLCENKIIMEGNGMIFNLPKEKLIDVSIKTNMEIQKAYVSSAGGAVAGALLFGPLGALIGGRAKEKRNTTITKYLIFTYEKEGNPDYIAFDTTGSFKDSKFVKDFQEHNRQINREIEL